MASKALLKKYPPMREGKIYVMYWEMFLEDVSSRDNFKRSHLATLDLLCKAYDQMWRLQEAVDLIGEMQDVKSAQGESRKPVPEVSQMNVLRGQIAVYTKMLGLVLTRDTSPADEDKSKEEWK